MKKVFVLALVSALAAPALAFKVYYRYGKMCKHTKNQMPWTMRFNELGTPDCANEFAALANALDTWSNVRGQWYRNKRGANTSKIKYDLDGVNLCVWYEPGYPGQPAWPFAAGAIATNAFWLVDAGSFWRVVENDVCFNGYNYTWSDSGQGGRMDVQNIATHEFGHNLVLADLYDYASREFTMYGYASPGETKKRTLEYDDINGIRFIYGNEEVKLDSFTATARGDYVEVVWKVILEVNHAGYNLYRKEDAGGAAEYAKLNRALITGRSPYSYKDEGVEAGMAYKYLLEAVDLSGHKERFGPVRVEMPAGARPAFALAQSRPNPARTAATI
ncbi:MAG: matrixin family metalloprotease, partial [candidate division Zixibacteria bacterium]|nr:matrixin family metalloprotease [candidate division Zixibacteria bacterium]